MAKVCAHSASLLHTGELRCVTGGKAGWGEAAAWFGCGMLVRFFWRAYLCEYLGGQRGRWNRYPERPIEPPQT
jgi:hypothetical protein